jgi:hypothetical protein
MPDGVCVRTERQDSRQKRRERQTKKRSHRVTRWTLRSCKLFDEDEFFAAKSCGQVSVSVSA